MIIDRHTLKILKATGTDESRPVLQGLHIKDGHAEATNGHILARVPLLTVNPEECPADWQANGESLDGVILDPADLQTIGKGLQRVKSTMPILQVASIRKNGEGLRAAWGLDGDIYNVKQIEGTFPDLEKVQPKEKPTLQVAINSKYLRTIADLAEKGEKVIFTFRQKRGEVQYLEAVEFETKADRPIKGLVMPMRF